MTDRFSLEELRAAVIALDTIETQGDPDEWAAVLCQARDSTPSADPWGNVAIGARMTADNLARRLASLLGVPVADCQQAAARVFGLDRARATYEALLAYADELAGQPSARQSSATPTEPHRPAVRIVCNREGVA